MSERATKTLIRAVDRARRRRVSFVFISEFASQWIGCVTFEEKQVGIFQYFTLENMKHLSCVVLFAVL